MTVKKHYYHHFVRHCGAFFGLKWRIWRVKMYFSPPKGGKSKKKQVAVKNKIDGPKENQRHVG